jgi:hypothetical protein
MAKISNFSQAAANPAGYLQQSYDPMSVPTMTGHTFIEALSSTAAAADRADKMKLYGRLIGRWAMDATVYRDDGTRHQGPGEIYFAWVLEGRAIQDVWILPGIFYGTTLRVYDPDIDA